MDFSLFLRLDTVGFVGREGVRLCESAFRCLSWSPHVSKALWCLRVMRPSAQACPANSAASMPTVSGRVLCLPPGLCSPSPSSPTAAAPPASLPPAEPPLCQDSVRFPTNFFGKLREVGLPGVDSFTHAPIPVAPHARPGLGPSRRECHSRVRKPSTPCPTLSHLGCHLLCV